MPATNDPEVRSAPARVPDSRRVEQVLLGHASIADCAVLERAGDDGQAELVAYIVPASAVGAEELLARLDASAASRPARMVSVSSIPLTPDGRVDVSRLSRLPVIDKQWIERWETAARSVNGIEHAAVVVDGSAKRSLHLHLSDLLPDWTLRPSSPALTITQTRGSARSETMAIVDGDPLTIENGAPASLAEALDRAAATSPHGVICIESDGSAGCQSYRDLLARALRILAGLQAAGLAPLDRVVLQLERHQDFIETFWACVLGGLVPVPLAVPAGYDKLSPPLQTLQSAWHVLDRPHIVTVRCAVDDVEAAAARLQLDGARVHAVEDLCGDAIGRRHQSDADDLALLMLTSGSTGTPKAVTLTHRNVLSRTTGSRQLNGFSDRDVSVNWMPLDHVAGLIYFHIRDVYLGCRQIHVPTARILQDPLGWLDYLHEYKATITFAPNFAFALVNDRAHELAGRSWDLSAVRFVLNGAEAIVARTARRFLSLLGPFGLGPACMHPAWGMSETSSGVIYGDTFALATSSDEDPFVEVGRPIPGLSLRIVDTDDCVMPEGSVGRLQVRGPSVTAGYFRSPELTREAFTADGWFSTGDLGTVGHGRLTITGREKDVVIINSVNYYCHAIESVVDELDGVETSLTAACAVRPVGADTDRLAIFFHASDAELIPDLLARIRADVTARIGIAPDYLLPVEAVAIPKTSLGKIQRSELSRRFLEGEFDEVLKEVDRSTAGPNTIPDWFYRKIWRRKDGASDNSLLGDGATALLFVTLDALGSEIRERLRSRGVRCFTVEAGDAFAMTDEGGYRLDPHQESDYDRLLEDLSDARCTPSHIIHLWGYSPYIGETIGKDIEDAQFDGVLSALWLTQALARHHVDARSVGLTFVASHSQSVRAGERVAYEKTPAIGLLKSVPQEIPWLRCRHVDLAASDPATAASLIVDELCVPQPDREVAYRDGHRFVAGLESVVFEAGAHVDLFRPDGTYLITGGAGGIGEQVAALLVDRFNANLLLLGQGPLDARRGKLVESLGRHGGRIAYETVDVGDESRLIAVVDAYTTRWGLSIDGVIHLAGIYHESIATEETAERFLAMLRPKTIGTDVLHRLMAAQGEGFVISFSSIAGFFGGASIGAYAAANSFQDAFAAHFRGRGSVRHYCFSWSNWNEVGQSRAYQLKDAPRVRGYLPIAPSQGLQSLLIGLKFDERGLLVGLDGAHRHVRRSLLDEPDLLDTPVLYYTASNGCPVGPALHALEMCDRFGTPSHPTVVRVPRMPFTRSGDIDRDLLARLGRGRDGHAPSAQPRTDAERRLADVWKQVLAVPTVGRDDNFFELGGDSLLAARLISRIRETFGGEISLRAIFDASTLSDLAELIEKGASSTAGRHERPAASVLPINPADVLARLDELGDDEVDALLHQLASRVVEK